MIYNLQFEKIQGEMCVNFENIRVWKELQKENVGEETKGD